jgi:hypothetical protein
MSQSMKRVIQEPWTYQWYRLQTNIRKPTEKTMPAITKIMAGLDPMNIRETAAARAAAIPTRQIMFILRALREILSEKIYFVISAFNIFIPALKKNDLRQ